MFENIESFTNFSPFQGISKPFLKVLNRKKHIFVFRINGTVVYNFGNKEIIQNKNELIFIPQGASYELRTISDDESNYTSISFQADLNDPKPTLYSLEGFADSEYICRHFVNLWKFGTQSEKYMCLSLFYNLLAYISNIENSNYIDSKKFEKIEPAVTYLKAHIFDCSLKADKLHILCGMSDTYFRKIFTSRFGISPRKYIISKRISHAKSMIDSGNFDSIQEVAASVGYSDPLYFSRAFKSKYGNAPSDSK